MVRDAGRRINKYSKKIVGEIAKQRTDAYKDTQVSVFKSSVGKQVEIEDNVKAYMSNNNFSSLDTNYYILFLKRLLSKRYFKSQEEANITFNKWAQRGLNFIHLRNLGRNYAGRRLDLKSVCAVPGIVGHWTFYEGAGSTAHDVSPGGNHMISGVFPSWQDGIIGKCLQFNGTTHYIYTPYNSNLTISSACSFRMWVKLTDLTLNNKILSSDVFEVYVGGVPDGVVCLWLKGLDDELVSSTSALLQDVWYQLTLVYDGSSKIIYIDGVYNWHDAATGNVDPLSSIVTIGKHYLNAFYAASYIDEVQIWDVALTPAQIKQMYDAEKPFFT